MAVFLSDPDKLALLMGGKLPEDDDQSQSILGEQVRAPGSVDMGAMRGFPTAATAAPTPDATATVPPTAAATVAQPQPDIDQSRPPLPATPNFEPQPLDRLRQLQDQITQRAQPVSYEQNKPHWYDRLLGFGLGSLAGYGNADRGAEVARNLTFRKYIGAVSQQERDLNPLYKQLEMEEKLSGNINQENERRQNTFSDSGSNYDRYLKTVDADNTVRQREPRIEYDKDGNPHFYYRRLGGTEYEGAPPANWINAQRRNKEDESTPAVGARPEKYIDPQTKKPAWRVKTKSGDYMPYSFKSVDEAAVAGDERGTKLFSQAHPGKKEGASDQKPATKQQFQGVQNKRDRDWAKARSDYNKELLALSPTDSDGAAQSRQDFYDRRQEVQNEYESGVGNLGGTAEHTELPRNLFGEKESAGPAAKTAAPGAQPSSAAQPKTVARSVVQQYAKEHKVGSRQMTYEEAAAGFKQKNYVVQ